MFVTKIQPETNTVVLGTIEELEKKEAWVRNLNLVKYDKITEPLKPLPKYATKMPVPKVRSYK
jgi:tRNA-specific 2-thiouridylase